MGKQHRDELLIDLEPCVGLEPCVAAFEHSLSLQRRHKPQPGRRREDDGRVRSQRDRDMLGLQRRRRQKYGEAQNSETFDRRRACEKDSVPRSP